MGKKSLKMLNLQELSKLLEDFGKQERIFNSEAQFQFELAWKIREEYDCEVFLEALSRVTKVDEKKTKNDYTDIILEKDGLRIAVELKYKTALLEDVSPGGLYLRNHGAVDLGAYDFMWDVNRLQILTNVHREDVRIKCDRGYAVILTNDHHYWTEPKNKNTINRMFLIYGDNTGNGCLAMGVHEWYNRDGIPGYSKALQTDKSRQPEIDLRKDYQYKWQSYYTIAGVKNGEFRFMIVEVN